MKEQIIPVKYGIPRHGLGRVSPSKALGLTGFSKRIRNTLIQSHYRDLDLCNAQPQILYNICKGNEGMPNCDYLHQLIYNRETILQNVMKDYSVSRNKAKKLFLRLAFYGTFYGWCVDCGIDTSTKANSFIIGLTNELKNIANHIKTLNKPLYEKVRKICPDKENLIGSFMAFYLQTYELHILNAICEYLCNETNLCDVTSSKLKILTYEYDGIKLLKKGVDAYGVDALCRKLESIVKVKTGFDIVLEEKPIDEYYDVEYDDTISNDEGEKFEDKDKSYENIKYNFELTHSKIINKIIFIKEQDNTLKFFKKEELKTAYEHLHFEIPCYDKEGKLLGYKKKPFMNEWLKDENINKFEDMGIYPPPLNCPDNIFNLWRPFAMELVTDWKFNSKTIEGFDAILEHILMLCDYDVSINNYFIKWMAQMVQFPAVKTICPILISKEGAGKGTLLKILERMLGFETYMETTDPLRDVFGAFNELMIGKFLVNINEVSKKDTNEAIGKIKGLVTDGNLVVNTKGIKKVTIKSYHRFIMTTNSEDPIVSKKGDRRNFIIRSSDAKCGDKKYFKKLNEYIDDINVIKMFYEYLKNGISNMENFGQIELPVTEYQQNLQENSVSPVEQWLRDFTMENYNEAEVEMLGKEALILFNEWCKNNNVKFECNATQLMTKVCNLRIIGIEKGRDTNKGNTRIYKIPEMKKHFNIGCLIEFKSQVMPDNDDTDDI